jgi:membrane-bound lytic murein transglycosylase F
MKHPGTKFLYIIFFAFILIIATTYQYKIDNKIHIYFLEGKTLRCEINVAGGIYLKRGQTKGFHYDLLKEFSKYEKCRSVIKPSFMNNYWNDLAQGKIDILVINSGTAAIPEEYSDIFVASTPLNELEDVWVVRKSNYDLILHLNEWLTYFQQSVKYTQLINHYYKRYNYIALTPATKGAGAISPYDNIIKKYAAKIGWDWRLIASLIYQESGFEARARSHRGAQGLMQIRSGTADRFGVTDLLDPEQNIKAGTQLIRNLERMYSGTGIDSANRVKFVLAAYNAGEGRINDLISFARYKGLNHTNWDSLVKIIPMMKMESIPQGVLKFGLFKGGETINHIDQVLSRYEEYKAVTGG